MTGSQAIILGLIALTTLVGSVEASSHSGYRITFARFALALIVPCIWATLILFLPLGNWLAVLSKSHGFVFLLLLIISIITAPIWFIGSIVIWVGASLCGDLKKELQSILKHFAKKS